jgi:acyl-CoA synthetase (AMP-forming)/AMP-acid ligase II
VTLRATVRHSRHADYLRPGGPWDIESLDAVLSSAPGRAAERLVDGEIRLRSDVFEKSVSALAGGLRRLGVERGSVVAWQLPNWNESVLLFRACWRLGAIAAPIHRALGRSETEGALDSLAPNAAFAARGAPALDAPGAIAIRSGQAFDALLEGEPVPASASDGRPADLAVALLTAGSTGVPKLVLHTQRALAYKARLMAAVHALHRTDAVLMPAPLAHISGLLNGVLVPGVTAMKSVLLERWDPDAAVTTVDEEGITFMIGPPTFFVGMTSASTFTPKKVGSLRLISCGGSTVTPAFVSETAQRLGCRVKRTYGSTEAPSVTTSTGRASADRARVTDGRPVGEVELLIADTASGAVLAPREVGEVWVRGPEVFVGYADAGQTSQAFARGGWYRTGDLGSLDTDGWLTISGRLTDVIIRGGENILASEVEGILNAHPAVKEAVVVPYPDDVMGERMAAFVVAKKPFDLAACGAWFKQKGVTAFKTPERVIQVESLPTIAAGKPDRAALTRLAGKRSG